MQGNIEEQVVGGGGPKNSPPDEFSNSTSQAVDNSGPLEQRIVSKNWLIRANAFEELTTQFKSADNQFSQEFKEHASSWKKYLADANPGSLEKCLEALEVFINRADPKLVASSQNDIIKILIEKCIGHAKPTIKTKSLDCFNLLFEVSEAFDDSIETITESLNSKNAKISQTALVTLNSWLTSYGVKKIKIKSFLSIIENAAGSSNPAMRQEAMTFYKECYLYLGESLKALISGLKKQQLDDLDKDFKELKDKPKGQLRLTRTEKEKLKDAALDDIIKDEEQKGGIDTYDLVDAVDLITKYGSSEWQDKVLEGKTWKEKKDKLDELFNDSNVPKIKAGDFSGVAKLLKKMIGDSNIVVSQTAVKVCGNLAKGLRKDFEGCCKELLPTLIAKFREKKTMVIEDTNQVLQSFMLCTNLENILSEISAGLQDKAPSVKKFVCMFIEKTAQETYIDILQRISGEMLQVLIKASDDPQSEVRDAALSALGIFKGRLGDSAMSKFLLDLNPQKLQKLNESAQNVKPSKYDRPEKKEIQPDTKAAAPPKKKVAEVKKVQPKKQEQIQETYDEQPIGGEKNSNNNFDEQPIGGKKNNNTGNEFDEQPIGGKKNMRNDFDEQPIGGAKKDIGNEFDEQPINKKKQTGNTFDEQPIGGTKKAVNQLDDQPIGGNKNTRMDFDDQPIGGKKNNMNIDGADDEEMPLPKGAYNLDQLDDMDAFGTSGGFGNPPPIKKKVPVKQQKKPIEEEKKDDGDAIMNDESVMSPKKQETKKAPVKQPIAKASTTTVTAKTTGKPSGPQIQEEDVGAGLSKEEAEAKVQEAFSPDIVQKFEETKWQDKVEGFKGISEQVISLQPPQDVIEGLVKFVKGKMKDWKESNLNLIKESIALFLVISQNCEKINKRAVSCMMPFLSDKIGDVKLIANINEILLNLSEIVTPKYIALQVIKHGSTAKSPNVLKETSNILIKMTDDFGVANMALKEMIDYAILAANHTNPQVRTSAMALFAMMYKHGGEMIKNFLKDIKESTLKLIEEEFSKVTILKKGEFVPKRGLRGEAAAAAEAAPKKGGAGGGLQSLLDDALPRQDISKNMGPKLMPMFKHADWKVRKEAAEKVEEMCRAANMRIQPIGLNELMDNMKQRMVDPHKAVLKSYIQLMGVLVEALGVPAKQFQKKLLPGMLATLADKQTLVRADAIACMDKWAEHVGPEVILNNLGPMLTQENPELRTEALKWIIKQKDAIKNSEAKEYVKALVSCLSDKTPAIRNLAEEVCGYVMPYTGYQPFSAVLSDLLPAVQSSIKPILERIKQKVGTINVPQDQMNNSSGLQKAVPSQQQQIQQQQPIPQQQQQQNAPGLQKQNSLKPQIKPKVQGSATNVNQGGALQDKPPMQNLNQSLQPGSSLNQSILKKKENQTPAAKQQVQQRSASREMVKPKGLSQTITSFKQPEEVVQEGVTVNFGYKEKRSEFDKKTKFQLEDIKGDQIEKLKSFTTQCLGQTFCAKMFSNDFKLHVECIDAFNYLMAQQPDALKEILDIIFKWSLVKLQDSANTKFAISIFDFFSMLFQQLEESEYFLWDFEAQIIIPLLCERAGINNNILKDKVKKLIRMTQTIYDLRKCYLLIVQYGLNSKNLRAQAECLDELAEYITKYGVDNCSEKELKIVAKMADNADKNIRENALKFMGEAYKILSDNIWRAIGDVTPKVTSLLEQRFKKLKFGGVPGLTSSNSQSDFFKPESNQQFGREQSPKQSNQGFKTNVPQKQSIQKTVEMGKQSTTPRNNLQFTKSSAKIDNNQQNNLSKSINKFNQSNKSDDEPKRTPYQDPRKEMKKVMSQDNSSIANQFGKRPILNTQRPGDTQSDFNQVQRGSEPSQQNSKSSFLGMKQQENMFRNTNQMFYPNDGEDEDLRILTEDNFGADPELERAQDEITKHIHQLKYADLSKRVDSLVSLNEMITDIEKNKPVLVRTANELVSAFTHVLNDIFDKSVDEIPLRFAKYFITIVLKTCSCKEIMREVSEEKVFDLAEQLLTRLLIDNLDKVGDNKEGELILKNLNSSMLRLLENCNHTYIFCVLFNLLRKYKDYGLMPKLPNLIIKCLLKLSKILEKLIDKLDMEKILLAIHEYLVVINHDNKTQNDEMGIRIVKTVTNELVKLKRDSIWEAYRVIQCHGQPDNHIYRWIQIILKSLQTQGTTPSGGSNTGPVNEGDEQIKLLVNELRNPETFESAIPKVQRFLEQNPTIDLNDYVQECSKTFQQFVKTNLEKYKLSLKDEGKQRTQDSLQNSLKSTSNTDNSQIQPQDPVQINLTHQNSNSSSNNRISEYQSKLASIKMRNTQKSGAETATNRQQQSNLIGGGQNTANLNTSFSAMNSSLSQKWTEINKKSAFTKREGGTNVQQMSSTMGGGFTHATQNLESRIGMGQNATQQPMNQSLGGGSNNDQNIGSGGGATNQDLNERLAVMKAKLQALKKK